MDPDLDPSVFGAPTPPPPKGRPVLVPQANARAISAQPALVKLFAQHFVHNGFNAMKAAVAAGFVNPSPTFVRNLADSRPVKRVIAELLGPYTSAMEHVVTPETVKRELARIAFGDVRGLFRSDGSLKSIADIDDDTAAGVSSVEVEVKRTRTNTAGPEPDSDSPDYAPPTESTETRILKIKRYDKLAALNILARHTKLVGDDAQDGVNALAGALASRLDAAKRRMGQDVEDIEANQPPAQPTTPQRQPVIQSEPIEPEPHDEEDPLY